MAIEQIIKTDNGDGTTTVTVVTEKGNVGTETYSNYSSQSTIDDANTAAAEEALYKDK